MKIRVIPHAVNKDLDDRYLKPNMVRHKRNMRSGSSDSDNMGVCENIRGNVKIHNPWAVAVPPPPVVVPDGFLYNWPALIRKEVVLDDISYGFLYNWYAATDVRNITAIGWSVPTVAQFQTLIAYLGGSNATTANKLRDTDPQYWNPAYTGATNESGFYGRGAGSRWNTGFEELLSMERICVTNVYSATETYIFSLSNYIGSLTGYVFAKINGRSIRIVKNSTTLTHGQTGTYTGNDGKIYRTICIGTQEWLADNLAETKFRDGTWIPGFDGGVYTPISNAAWAALTTSALCAYNDDLNLV